MTNIGFASMDWARSITEETGIPTMGGAGWARCGQPARYLKKAGHKVYIGTPIFKKGLGFGVRRWEENEPDVFGLDTIVLQRIMDLDVHEDIEHARSLGQRVVNDIDDWFFGLHDTNFATRTVTKERLDIYLKALRASSFVTASTSFLAERLQSEGCWVELLRNAVALDDWTLPAPEFPRDRPVRIGWVGAVPWRSNDIETLRGVFSTLLRRHPDTEFVHVGHIDGIEDVKEYPPFWKLAGVPEEKVETRPMRSVREIPLLYSGFDIGLVPLNDIPFNRAKSWIKGTEYAAGGIPFVAQALPEYKTLYHSFGIGAVAKNAGQWIARIEDLMTPDGWHEQQERNAANIVQLDFGVRYREWQALLT